ncbi:MAG: DUF4331 domain-containing protein [Akkermansiaceae bacterium]|nr:DUF4331 domain-containing protein [Verrucomicrobiales bacterium]
MINRIKQTVAGVALAAITCLPGVTRASSHMDAPLITLDPAVNTTDVYAFVQGTNNQKSLVVALGVYPFEEPGIGPNKYNFDDNALYEIHLAVGSNSVALGRTDVSYQFKFTTQYKNKGTILQSYLGVIQNIGDANQNLTQTYTVTKVDHRRRSGNRRHVATLLGRGVVPPNNQGIASPLYNQGNNGENPAKGGVATEAELDTYTAQAVTNLANGYVAFAGQRDDGFFGDIQAIFDLLQLRSPGKDAQGGYNIHLMALEIPLSELGGDQQVVGVYASTSRRQITLLRDGEKKSEPKLAGNWIQVARQGNPLFNEGLVAIADKDLYSRTDPSTDKKLFSKYALNPELAKLINAIVFSGAGPAPETNRTDIAGIFIPDVIKVDLSTGPARLAGGGASHPTNPDDAGFSRLSIFGGDTLTSTIQPGFGNGTLPGGWPNGRRFGDDVVDIAVTALISDLRTSPPTINGPAGDNVNQNDMTYSKVFPYESTPQNGRNHSHHGE